MTLFADDANPLWRSDWTPATEVALPDAVLTGRAPARYFWAVEAEGDVARHRLGPFWFRIAP